MSFPKRINLFIFCPVLVLALLGIVLAQGPPANPGPPVFGLLAGKTLDFSAARSLPYRTSDQTMFENVIVDGLHYAVLMKWMNARMQPADLYPITTVQIPNWVADWSGIEPLISDPLGDAEPGSPSGTDFTALYMMRDSDAVYFRLDLDAPPPVGFTYSIGLSQYLNQQNTPGDLTAETTCPAPGYRSTMVWGMDGPGFRQVYQASDVSEVVGNSIRWRVPISTLRYMPGVPAPSSPPSPLGPQGIENRFLAVTVWGEKGSVAEGFRDGINDPRKSPMIINFW